MKKILLILLVVAGLATGLFLVKGISGQVNFLQFFQGSDDKRQLLLPDIVPTTPLEIYIRNSAGKKTLRFSTTFYNQGQGPLELVGHTNKENNITYASQYIYEKGGAGLYRDIGGFVFHPPHTHWHVDQYVFYELWNVNDKGEANSLMARTDKMSFCIWDERAQDLKIADAPQARVYPRTCNGRQQGMSVGWSDTYSASIEGQELNITEIPDGIYIFRSIINPDKKIAETDYDNNQIDITIEIKGSSLIRK